MSYMKTKKTPSETIREAVAHMEKVGFHQGGFYKWPEDEAGRPIPVNKEDLPCCIRGALEVVTKDGQWAHENDAYECLAKHVPPTPPTPSESPCGKEPVAAFNDTHSFAEVKAWALAAAEACEKECNHSDASRAPREAGE